MAWCFTSIFASVCTISNLTTAIALLLTSILLFLSTKRRRGIPPGPRLWPIVGNIPSMITKDVLGQLRKLRLKYGDIYGLYVGSELSVFLNGYDLIHDAFVKKGSLFSVRPVTKYKRMIISTDGVVFLNGSGWKKRRAFSMKAFNDICFSKQGRGAEEKIIEEIDHLIDKLDKSENPIDPKDHMDASFANITFSILHGRRVSYDDTDFKWFMAHLKEAFSKFTKDQVLLSCFSFLDGFPFDPLKLKSMDKRKLVVEEYHRKMCEPNFANYVEGSKDCFFDCYLTDVRNNATVKNKMEGNDCKDFFDESLWSLLHDMMAAGSETCATTFNWIILHLALNPDVKHKLHGELDSKLGPGHAISVADRDNLPFVQATVLEGLRISTVVPLALPHGVNEDTMFRGYIIPKGAQVYANLASVLKDPGVFKDLGAFNPERFLSEDNSSVKVPKEFIPFSAGPRSCMGETLAKQELFLYTARLFQKFDVALEPSSRQGSLKGEFGITYQPQRFKVHFKVRNWNHK